MLIQTQHWSDKEKYILMLESGEGSCQLDLYSSEGYACIYSLYVNPESREKGLATKLLEKAEEIATFHGYNEIRLNFNHSTPDYILDWYKRKGYNILYAELSKQL